MGEQLLDGKIISSIASIADICAFIFVFFIYKHLHLHAQNPCICIPFLMKRDSGYL